MIIDHKDPNQTVAAVEFKATGLDNGKALDGSPALGSIICSKPLPTNNFKGPDGRSLPRGLCVISLSGQIGNGMARNFASPEELRQFARDILELLGEVH